MSVMTQKISSHALKYSIQLINTPCNFKKNTIYKMSVNNSPLDSQSHSLQQAAQE